ncbi:recombinase family protein [Algoriphagus resistens]|uniref:recombinase family protein n=1 Tax=Algoriphagus resistens TaxID=1750590 RepID=UPI0021CDB3DD|nr:recombinase family protein [Algoriphagus resistens]
MLRKYCEFNHLQVGSIVFEDYSARNFDRPEWQKLLANCRKLRGQTQQILFTKWDRFCRNTWDAYQMISTLSNLGIKAQSIEQF